MILVALALQLAAGPTLPDANGCRAAAPDEVLVCARRTEDSPYRTKPLPPPPLDEPRRNPLGFVLPGGGTGTVHAIQTTLPGGFTGQGVAVTLKMPFGGKKRR